MKGLPLKDAKTCVGEGWWPILETLYAAKPRNVKVIQVKEKYATLRFYCDKYNNEFTLCIVFAEALSGRVCELCGRAGKIIEIQGWYMTRCKECERKEKEQHGNEVAGR